MSAAIVVNNIFYLYFLLIILRIFLTWIPNIDWYKQPLRTIREITDVYLDIFRRFIPPIGGLDISPIVAIFVLELIKGVVVGLLATFAG